MPIQTQHAAAKTVQRGFTLLELMVVVAIIALTTVGATLALRDGGATQLEREGLRLAALLESARAQSRTSGIAVQWRATAAGFEFLGVAPRKDARDSLAEPRAWLQPETQARVTQPFGAQALVLGPEPLIAAQRVVIFQGERRLTLATDGISAFAVVPESATP